MVAISTIANSLNAKTIGDAKQQIYRIASLADAEAGDICFSREFKSQKIVENCRATAVIVSNVVPEACSKSSAVILVCADIDYAYAKTSQILAEELEKGNIKKAEIHTATTISKSAKLGTNISIGSGSYIGDDVILGDGVSIGSNCSIRECVSIAKNTTIYSNVVVEKNVKIGANCIIQSGTIIGSEGFGYGFDKTGTPIRKHHFGSVYIDDYVEIGANCTIDRGAFGSTRLDEHAKLDNLIHIAHNCHIGAKTCIAANTIFAGSVTVGKRVLIGGGCRIGGHLHIADGVILHGDSTITRNLESGKQYSSKFTAQEFSKWKYNVVAFGKLRQIMRDVTNLKRQSKKELNKK